MRFTLLAVGVGFVVAGAMGGRPSSLAGRTLRLWFLLPLGLALFLAATEQRGDAWPFVLVLIGYACLVAFTVANLSLTGMWMLALGLVLNIFVIGLNHGMPVGKRATRTIGHPPAVYAVDHHPERGSDKLRFLGDVVPVRPIGEALSFGDLIFAVGLVDVIVRLLRPAPVRQPRRQRETEAAARPLLDGVLDS